MPKGVNAILVRFTVYLNRHALNMHISRSKINTILLIIYSLIDFSFIFRPALG
jgi:hypothetical protein